MGKSRNRLAIYLPNLGGGGAERTLLNLAIGFSHRNYPVDFVLAQREGQFLDQIPDSVRLIVLNPLQLNAGRTVLSLPALVQYMRKERPSALVTSLHANIIAIWAKKIAGTPLRLVISEQNTFSVHNQMMPVGLRRLNLDLVRISY